MSFEQLRWLIVGLGILIPYLARLPRGTDWLMQYVSAGWSGALLLGAFNAIAWLAMLACTLLYRHPSSVWPSLVLGMGCLAYLHFEVDLAADAQASLALIVIPFMALAPIAVGALLGWVMDRFL